MGWKGDDGWGGCACGPCIDTRRAAAAAPPHPAPPPARGRRPDAAAARGRWGGAVVGSTLAAAPGLTPLPPRPPALSEAEELLKIHGRNELEEHVKPKWKLFVEQARLSRG